MKLTDFLPAEYIVIEIAESDLRTYQPGLLEAKGWCAASQAGWRYRVDAARPEMKLKRHVHIAQSNQISAKKKQVSWNDDGSRHDKKSFNANISGLGVAKRVAREVLGLPSDIVLEKVSITPNRRQVLRESMALDEPPEGLIVLAARHRA